MKNFEEWNTRKINIEKRESYFHFDEREVWWCAIGENVGEEICGKNNNFERPILIFKKHSKDTAFVLPLTSTIRQGNNYFNLSLKEKDRCVLLHQGRFVSRKRLLRRMETISENKFNLIERAFKNLYKIENPPCGGNSQAPCGEDIYSISDTNNMSSKNHKSKLIVLCGSMINMDKMNVIKDELIGKGYNVIAPELSEEEIKSGDKTFIDIINEKGGIQNIPIDNQIWKIKTNSMRDYIKHIEQSDAVLICNYTKGIETDKIGDNSYFEMSIAFYLKKKIFVLNGPPYKSSKCEEVIAMQSTFLYGDLNKLFI